MQFTFTDKSTGYTTTGNKWLVSTAISSAFETNIPGPVNDAVQAAADALENHGRVPDEETQALLNITVTVA